MREGGGGTAHSTSRHRSSHRDSSLIPKTKPNLSLLNTVEFEHSLRYTQNRNQRKSRKTFRHLFSMMMGLHQGLEAVEESTPEDQAKAKVVHNRKTETYSGAYILDVSEEPDPPPKEEKERHLPFYLQGRPKYATSMAQVKKRKILKKNPVIKAEIDKWWKFAAKGRPFVDKDRYYEVNIALYKVLNLPFDKEQATAASLEDWTEDAIGKPYLDYKGFYTSTFQLLDNFTEGVEASELCEFSKLIFSRVAHQNSLKPIDDIEALWDESLSDAEDEKQEGGEEEVLDASMDEAKLDNEDNEHSAALAALSDLGNADGTLMGALAQLETEQLTSDPDQTSHGSRLQTAEGEESGEAKRRKVRKAGTPKRINTESQMALTPRSKARLRRGTVTMGESSATFGFGDSSKLSVGFEESPDVNISYQSPRSKLTRRKSEAVFGDGGLLLTPSSRKRVDWDEALKSAESSQTGDLGDSQFSAFGRDDFSILNEAKKLISECIHCKEPYFQLDPLGSGYLLQAVSREHPDSEVLVQVKGKEPISVSIQDARRMAITLARDRGFRQFLEPRPCESHPGELRRWSVQHAARWTCCDGLADAHPCEHFEAHEIKIVHKQQQPAPAKSPVRARTSPYELRPIPKKGPSIKPKQKRGGSFFRRPPNKKDDDLEQIILSRLLGSLKNSAPGTTAGHLAKFPMTDLIEKGHISDKELESRLQRCHDFGVKTLKDRVKAVRGVVDAGHLRSQEKLSKSFNQGMYIEPLKDQLSYEQLDNQLSKEFDRTVINQTLALRRLRSRLLQMATTASDGMTPIDQSGTKSATLPPIVERHSPDADRPCTIESAVSMSEVDNLFSREKGMIV